MKLEKFKKYGKRNKKIICSVIGITIIISMFILFKSFAFFESQYNFDVIKGRIPPFNVSDVTLAFTIDGVKSSDVFPSIDSGYVPIGVTCQNGTTAEWSKDLWGLINVKPNGNKKINCNIEFKSPYREILLNGSYPVLGEEMIPVTIGTGGVVTYADILSLENVWYSYENKQWANAVILTSTGKTKNYTVGSKIAEADIESYFVWIPKYAYKIQTLGTSSAGQEKPFEIRFGTTNTVDNDTECIAPYKSGEDGNCAVGKYMTHPAFTSFGNIKGFWVGKFETTGNTNALTVKPNIGSYRGQYTSTKFQLGYNYKRKLDSHLMKNTEWGAMAYLTGSIYGNCTKTSTNVTCKNVGLNSTTTTGYGNGYVYSNDKSNVASTTENYSGIYDVTGGVWENVAGGLKGSLDISSYGEKYYDSYDNAKRILGDATEETYNWYGSLVYEIMSGLPFFKRSMSYNEGKSGGPYSFYCDSGSDTRGYDGMRLVLAPL